jgi:hypothetical protein
MPSVQLSVLRGASGDRISGWAARVAANLAVIVGVATVGCDEPRGIESGGGGSTLPQENVVVASVPAGQHDELVKAGDALWLQRGEESSLRAAIAKWDAAVKANPKDSETYYKLSRGCYLLADGYLAFDPARENEFMLTHERGVAYAEAGLLASSPRLAKLHEQGVKIEDAIDVLDRSAVPLLYWWDVNLGKWARLKGMTTMLQHKDRIFKVMTKVYQLDPDYFYGAPDRYFAGYFAVAPTFAGGDVNKSRTYFELSLKKGYNYLATHYLIAEYLAPKLQDKALFEREIKFVLDTPADGIPELVPEHMIEKKKAQLLLKRENELF